MYTKVKKKKQAVACIQSYNCMLSFFFSVVKSKSKTLVIFSLKILQTHFWPLSDHHSIPMILIFPPVFWVPDVHL